MPIRTVRVTINGVTYDLTDNGNGTYSKALTAPNVTSYNVNSGHYYPITVIATNMANTSTTINDLSPTLGTSCRLVVKEVTAPTITVSSPTAGQYLGTATPTFRFNVTDGNNGSGVAISTLSFTVDSTTYTNTSTGVNVTSITNGYSVVFTPTTALTDGSHTLRITVKDNDNNTGTSTAISFTTDTVAPTLAITNPATNGTYVANASLNVTGTASDATSGTPTVVITVNGTNVGNVTVSSGTFTKNVTLSNGNNTIVVTATDLAGKITTITRTIILDTSSPVIVSVSITPNPVNVGGAYTVTVSVNG